MLQNKTDDAADGYAFIEKEYAVQVRKHHAAQHQEHREHGQAAEYHDLEADERIGTAEYRDNRRHQEGIRRDDEAFAGEERDDEHDCGTGTAGH